MTGAGPGTTSATRAATAAQASGPSGGSSTTALLVNTPWSPWYETTRSSLTAAGRPQDRAQWATRSARLASRAPAMVSVWVASAVMHCRRQIAAGDARSDQPGHRRLGAVRAERPGPHRVREVPAELGVD